MGRTGDPSGGAATRHVRLKADLQHDADGTLRFVARCSCGWTSAPVSAGRVVEVWERHRDEARRRAP